MWDINTRDIVVGITKINVNIYQWFINNTFSILNFIPGKSKNLLV